MEQTEQRWWDWPAILFLFVAFWISSLRLEITDWAPDLERVIYLTLIAMILGFLLGKSKFPARFVFLYSVLFTVFVIPWQLGLTMKPQISWLERLGSLGGRLWTTYGQFTDNIPVDDSILFVFAMMLVYWIASLTAAYHLVRNGRPWFGLALISITTLIIEFYDPPRALRGLFTSLFAILVILLVSRLYFLNLHHRWKTSGIPVDNETSFDWMRAALISGLILVVLAWNIPTWARALSPGTPERRDFVQAWLQVRERFSNVVAPLSGTAPSEGYYYENDIQLGTSISSSPEIVFTVTSTEPRPGGARYYWRARTYDQYLNGEWSSTFTNREEVTATTGDLPIPDWFQRFDSTFTFTLETPVIRNFFTPGLPITISRPSQIVGNQVFPEYFDASTLLAVPPLRAGELYRVKASISAPTVNFLETSKPLYADWVQQYYLQLPEDFPARIRALAEEITQGLDTPYDKAIAITEYLRKNITYQTSVDPAPPGMDPIEYLLFSSKKGFCNYYASAEVLMLRSIGIPARMAVGFAEGEMNEKRNSFIVRSRDAHAWPEVYFTDFGWVEFEPTVIQTDLVRLEGNPGPLAGGLNAGPLQSLDEGNERLRGVDQNPSDFLPVEPSPQSNLPADRSIIIWLAILVLMFPMAVVFIFWMRSKNGRIEIPPLPIVVENNLIKRGFTPPGWIHERARLARLTPLERTFSVVSKSLRLLGQPPKPSLTPAEQVAQLTHILPQIEEPARDLLNELQLGMYSPSPANLEVARMSSRQISRQAWRARLRRLLRRNNNKQQLPGF